MKLHLSTLLLLFCLPILGQPQHTITRYNIEDGLPQQTITGITRDRNGYMWFTTWNGLCRFNGHSFVTYRVMPGDANDLATNRIDDIKIDARNHLWLLDDESTLYRFHPESNKFDRLTSQTAPAQIYSLFPMGIPGYSKQMGVCWGLLRMSQRWLAGKFWTARMEYAES